jgi:hypothetical protein
MNAIQIKNMTFNTKIFEAITKELATSEVSVDSKHAASLPSSSPDDLHGEFLRAVRGVTSVN